MKKISHETKQKGFQTIVKARPTSNERKFVLCYDLDQKENASFSSKITLKYQFQELEFTLKLTWYFW